VGLNPLLLESDLVIEGDHIAPAQVPRSHLVVVIAHDPVARVRRRERRGRERNHLVIALDQAAQVLKPVRQRRKNPGVGRRRSKRGKGRRRRKRRKGRRKRKRRKGRRKSIAKGLPHPVIDRVLRRHQHLPKNRHHGVPRLGSLGLLREKALKLLRKEHLEDLQHLRLEMMRTPHMKTTEMTRFLTKKKRSLTWRKMKDLHLRHMIRRRKKTKTGLNLRHIWRRRRKKKNLHLRQLLAWRRKRKGLNLRLFFWTMTISPIISGYPSLQNNLWI
jgi:hypothetical protein